ncbi:hypothetical protein B0H13DRAFT_1632025 [Mycena leptocephala]|nr:hypothetical protein B0H13DRAFT_1632025 [Mycena leptocephala]
MNLSTALSTVLTAVATLLIPYPGFWTNVQPELPIELTSDATWPSLCPQVDALLPDTHSALLATLNGVYKTEEFKLGVYEKLGGAVGIPTESYDDMQPVGQDSRWDIFQRFHDFLERSFPLIYSSLRVTKVNTYGLVFHWQGSTPLKPLLLTAHQDVVPVDPSTVDQWTHPPYSGHYDGTWIWGRGSADDKSDLIAQLTAVDSLLRQGFKPRRTIVLAFGIDEESAGTEGAGKIAVYLEETYGRDSFAFLLDEGDGYGENVRDGLIFASPGISEKGYFDLKIEVFSAGGHSSVPPQHTSIGIISQIIVALEHTLHEPSFPRSGTAFTNVQCAIAHGPNSSASLKLLARKALTDDGALEELKNYLLQSDPVFDAMLRTTQAVDIIYGEGVKVNALPEVATAVVNHRIVERSSVIEVQKHIVELVSPIATEFNMSLIAFGLPSTQNVVPVHQIVLSDAFGTALEPSPVTPLESGPYELLAGTIKAALETAARYNSTGVIISPSLGLDTQFYWNLTCHIFRYSHYGDRDDYYNGLHTVNEAVLGEAVVEHIRFFTTLILNSDETILFD